MFNGIIKSRSKLVSLANYTLAVLIVIGLIAALFGGTRKGARS